MKKVLKKFSIALFLFILLPLVFTACGDENIEEPDYKAPYVGTYRFDRFVIYHRDTWQQPLGDDEYLYTGDFDDCFAELLRSGITLETLTAEAESQYAVLNANGTMTWHLPNYMSYESTAGSVASGPWGVDRYADDTTDYFWGNPSLGSTVYGFKINQNKEYTSTIWFMDQFHNDVRYQFSGQIFDEEEQQWYSAGPDGNSYWWFEAVYKKVEA